jgi:hypothetical protein
MARQAIDLTGTIQVGNGKPTPLFLACVQPCATGGMEVLLSADGRHVWLTLDKASAVAFADRLRAEATDDNGEGVNLAAEATRTDDDD